MPSPHRVQCGQLGISLDGCEELSCCYDAGQCFFGNAGEFSEVSILQDKCYHQQHVAAALDLSANTDVLYWPSWFLCHWAGTMNDEMHPSANKERKARQMNWNIHSLQKLSKNYFPPNKLTSYIWKILMKSSWAKCHLKHLASENGNTISPTLFQKKLASRTSCCAIIYVVCNYQRLFWCHQRPSIAPRTDSSSWWYQEVPLSLASTLICWIWWAKESNAVKKPTTYSLASSTSQYLHVALRSW